jgi:deoxycytidylate deaminase
MVDRFLRQRTIDQVIAVAMVAEGPKRVGAILLRKNRIIAAACNNYNKSDPLQARISQEIALKHRRPEIGKRVYGHAETLALKKLKHNDDADTIVVCRLSGKFNSKKLRMARPCICCEHLIINSFPSIKHVYYSTEKGFLYEYWG